MGVLLIHPPQVGTLGLQDIATVEPLALERLGACVRGHEVRLLDMRLDDDLAGALSELKPHTVGIACPFTTQVNVALRLAREVKEQRPEAKVLVGGHHPTLRPQDLADECVDAIVSGEGELTFPEVVECNAEGGDLAKVAGLIVNGPDGQQQTAPREAIANLDELPLPDRSLTARWRDEYFWMNQRPHALVETSRGCPHRCNFCSVWRFYGPAVRHQSPERVADEIAAVEEPWVFLTDDNFLLSISRARRAAEVIAERGLRKQYTFQARTDTIAKHPELIEQWRDIGLVCVFLGLEKASTEGLDNLDKRNTLENNEQAIGILKELGVGFTGNFIADPDWEPADFAKLREYVKRWELFNSSFSILTPLPGTTLFDELEGKLTSREWELFDLWHALLPTKLPREQFYAEFASLWQAAGDSTPASTRRRRVWRGLWQLLTGNVRIAHAKRIGQAMGRLRTAESYLIDAP